MHIDLPASIRLHRVAILGDWWDRFVRSLEDSGIDGLEISNHLLPLFFEEMLGLLESGDEENIPCHDRPPLVNQLAEFPTNISICLKLLNAGEAAIRSFLTDSCPLFRLEVEFMRECFLWDLNKATHILIHREIQGICEQSLRPITEPSGGIEGHDDSRRLQVPGK